MEENFLDADKTGDVFRELEMIDYDGKLSVVSRASAGRMSLETDHDNTRPGAQRIRSDGPKLNMWAFRNASSN